MALHFFYELAENDRHSKDAKENSLGTWKIVRDHSKDEGESGHQGEEGDVFWLKDYIEPIDITVTFVAEMLGVSRKAVSAIVNERKSIWASSNIGTAVPYNALLNRGLLRGFFIRFVEACGDIAHAIVIPCLDIETMGIFTQQAFRHEIPDLIRIGDHLAEKADREPALTRIVIDDIDHGKQGALVLPTVFGPQRVGDAGPGDEFENQVGFAGQVIPQIMKDFFGLLGVVGPLGQKGIQFGISADGIHAVAPRVEWLIMRNISKQRLLIAGKERSVKPSGIVIKEKGRCGLIK